VAATPFVPLMLADPRPAPLVDARLAYEPKYDGMRAEALVDPRAGVRLWSRDGNDKTAQFPEVAAALRGLARRVTGPTVLDGEMVAVDPDGRSLGFPPLSARIPLVRPRDIRAAQRRQPAAFIAFDLLLLDGADVRRLPLAGRRARLERLARGARGAGLQVSDFVRGDGRALLARAREEPGWEGVIAKRLDAAYVSGRRAPAWRKIKLRRRQTCVVGGFTEHHGARSRSLLLGVYDAGRLRYIGHAVTTVAEAPALWQRLARLRSPASPFVDPPDDTRTPPRWVQPRVLVEIEHDGWVGGKLRHPASFLGMREDVEPRSVRREAATAGAAAVVSPWSPPEDARAGRPPRELARLVRALEALEAGPGEGVLALPDGFALPVRDLRTVVWPAARITKGELLRYYVRVSPWLLPALRDRPLVGKYYPDGLRGRGFFQQRAPAEVPPGVDVRVLDVDIPVRRRLVGGALLTLLYMVDAGAISQDPWLSRDGTLDEPDHCVFDLDPMPGATFAGVREVARAVREALARLGVAAAFPKLSGASGLHVYVPLAPGTSYPESRTLCEAVARHVAGRHGRLATVERTVQRRGPRVYLDCLQNLRGKTLAAAYSARATPFAGVSTPVRWEELDAGVEPGDVTVRTLAARLREVGDLWAALRASPGVAPRALMPAPPVIEAGRLTFLAPCA
jgi:bifunctional non-homologous end joining protein LigD